MDLWHAPLSVLTPQWVSRFKATGAFTFLGSLSFGFEFESVSFRFFSGLETGVGIDGGAGIGVGIATTFVTFRCSLTPVQRSK